MRREPSKGSKVNSAQQSHRAGDGVCSNKQIETHDSQSIAWSTQITLASIIENSFSLSPVSVLHNKS